MIKGITRIEYISKGFEGIEISNDVRALCEKAGENILINASANGGEFAMSSRIVKAYGSRRVMTFVYTADNEAAKLEAEDKVLSGAVR